MSVFLYCPLLYFWNKVSHLTQSSPFRLGWLENKPLKICLGLTTSLPTQTGVTGVCWHAQLSHGTRDWTLVLSLYPLSHFPFSPFFFHLVFLCGPRRLNLEPCINCPGLPWTHYIAQAGPEHAILLFQPLRSWDCGPVTLGWAGKSSSYLFLTWGRPSQEISEGFYPTQYKALLNTVSKQWTVLR